MEFRINKCKILAMEEGVNNMQVEEKIQESLTYSFGNIKWTLTNFRKITRLQALQLKRQETSP